MIILFFNPRVFLFTPWMFLRLDFDSIAILGLIQVLRFQFF